MELRKYIEKNKGRIIDNLKEILAIPSISTLPNHKDDIRKCAEWLEKYMKDIGLDNVQSFKTLGNPVVYGEKIVSENVPTVLVYGHYDVQPAEPISEWTNPPFEPTIKDNKIFSRGSADDKGQFMIHLAAAEYYLKNEKKIPINIKFFIEGEEEVGSSNLPKFITDHKDLLKADYALISDSHMLAENKPAIDYGLRGLAYFEIEVTGPKQDVHSGLYGGAIQNPINALALIISKLKDENGKILIPGIYDKVRKVGKEEREMIRQHLTEEDVKKETGVKQTYGEEKYHLAERVGARPSLDIHGIWGGFAGEGAKTIIPSKAGCKVSIRIVPDLKVKEVEEMFLSYIDNITPNGVEVKVKLLNGGEAYLLDFRKPIMQGASKVLKEVFGNEPVFLLSGGSIPITEVIKTNLGIDTVLMGFGLPDDNLHGPNEKMNLNQILKGIEASVKFIQEMTK